MTTTTVHLHQNAGTNWITGIAYGYEVQAKCYSEPSDEYGMELDRRISKLWIKNSAFGVVYNYDRGLDWDDIEPELLADIVAEVGARIK